MAKILITSTDVMMIQFLVPHVQNLYSNGHQVDVACSNAAGYEKEGYREGIIKQLPEGSRYFTLHLERNPFSLKFKQGYTELKSIINSTNYDLIWTNEPVMSVATRLAALEARKKGTKLLYLVHGFHFFKGAPLINWVFYPVEKIMSYSCDAMCMINWADYEFCKRHMQGIPVYHIDGIGLKVNKFKDIVVDRDRKRKELGVSEDEILVLSVGELQVRKNHIAMLKAIASLNNSKIKYMICGCGALKDMLVQKASELGIGGNLLLPGHRYDIPEILKSADIFAHPSQREGLGIAAIEAMAAGLPLVSSNVQGIADFSKTGITGYCLEPNDVKGYADALRSLIENPDERKRMGEYNIQAAQKYDISNSKEQVLRIINNVMRL